MRYVLIVQVVRQMCCFQMHSRAQYLYTTTYVVRLVQRQSWLNLYRCQSRWLLTQTHRQCKQLLRETGLYLLGLLYKTRNVKGIIHFFFSSIISIHPLDHAKQLCSLFHHLSVHQHHLLLHKYTYMYQPNIQYHII